MFPYYVQPAITLGGKTLHAFGLLVALAVVLGSWLVLRRAVRLGMDRGDVTHLLLWTLGFGFLISHLEYLAFAEPWAFQRVATLWEQPALWLNLWNGMSAFGGILGGVLGAALYMWRRGWGSAERWLFLDAVAWSFPFAWAVARFGCYLAHDHPGIHTTSALAVQYPGGARYDLGLFDCFVAVSLGVLFLWLDQQPRPRGFYFLSFMFLYGPARLLLDHLRVEERFLGLTSGQYGALVMIAVALAVWRRPRRTAEAPAQTTQRWLPPLVQPQRVSTAQSNAIPSGEMTR
jgi:phosphatidylglycerol:prolipoprotein diacylglycerol transferase